MNIKEHIEAGHYPTTDGGMEIVQTSEGLTVHIFGVHPDGRIAGWLSSGDVSAYTWNAAGGALQERGGDLLPPPPRKVTEVRWAAFNRHGRWVNSAPTREALAADEGRDVHLAEVTCTYELPWDCESPQA